MFDFMFVTGLLISRSSNITHPTIATADGEAGDRAGRNSVLAGGSIKELKTPPTGDPQSKRDVKFEHQRLR
jgi:hypothetical protein